MTAEFIYKVRVHYEDTDCNGVVYHPNFLKFMERARCELLRGKGVEFRKAMEEQILFAIHSVQLEYLKPAYLEDILEVVTIITKVGGASLDFAQTICCPEDRNYVYCSGNIKVVCIDEALKPRPLPKSFLAEIRSGN